MRKAALALVAAAAVAGCNRQSTYETPRAGAPATPADDTWVAQPTDLSGEQVRIVQRALTSRGFQVDASGTFDAATQTALADFQRSRGLPATGNLNADTAAALGIAPEEVRPAPSSSTAATTTDRVDDAAGRHPAQAPEKPDTKTSPSTTSGATSPDR
ncbi:MAG TPA: peptidoglycan-binding domain-containing protein [Anaeromyxobacteraceae bacterium]|nr:peptidoglycan-binding domain-containing protein [Anaeromyxobacteraceae bacterium]